MQLYRFALKRFIFVKFDSKLCTTLSYIFDNFNVKRAIVICLPFVFYYERVICNAVREFYTIVSSIDKIIMLQVFP